LEQSLTNRRVREKYSASSLLEPCEGFSIQKLAVAALLVVVALPSEEEYSSH